VNVAYSEARGPSDRPIKWALAWGGALTRPWRRERIRSYPVQGRRPPRDRGRLRFALNGRKRAWEPLGPLNPYFVATPAVLAAIRRPMPAPGPPGPLSWDLGGRARFLFNRLPVGIIPNSRALFRVVNGCRLETLKNLH
jgi:hypothetical protein